VKRKSRKKPTTEGKGRKRYIKGKKSKGEKKLLAKGRKRGPVHLGKKREGDDRKGGWPV